MRLSLWAILAVAFVEGTGATFFIGAEPGALRAVVPATQLPAATAAREGRRSVIRLGGPPLGGALFGLSRALPFVVDAASYTFSTLSLLAMRTPFEEERERGTAPLRRRLAEGFSFMWQHAFLRTTAFIYGVGNFVASSVLLLIVVVGKREGLSPGVIGLLSVMELWTWLGCWLFVIWPHVWVLAAAVAVFGLAAPITDSVVVGYRLAMTPDRLVGRVESVRTTISLLVGALGPLAAGLLLESTSARATVAVFAAVGLGLALWGTLSPSIRQAPSLSELELIRK